jgi:Amt family ammonium transporter
MVIGMLAGGVCYAAIYIKNRRKWDDALDVWGVHGVGGILGTVCLGIFGSVAFNAAGSDGLLHGGARFFGVQTGAVLLASVWAFSFTYAMLWAINKFTPVRVSEAEEEVGLDAAEHGETAYQDESGLGTKQELG